MLPRKFSGVDATATAGAWPTARAAGHSLESALQVPSKIDLGGSDVKAAKSDKWH
jgi:hypothetical protein